MRSMRYAIIGFGSVGQSLAHMFARRDIEVTVAGRRAPEAIAAWAKAIGPKVVARSLPEALAVDTVLLAIPFAAYKELAKVIPSWEGKTVIDVTNAYGVPVEELGRLQSSAVIARALPGARLVKAFNHLPAKTLALDPQTKVGRRVIFVASDDAKASADVAELVERLGFAPVALGKLAEGGALVQARGSSWAPLIFQDLARIERATEAS